MKTLKMICSLFLLFVIQFYFGQKDNPISSKIESNFVEGLLNLKATATNNSDSYTELNYLFISIKRGNSGNLSNNKQSGKFSLKPDETKVLSQMSVNVQKNDALKVFLYVKDEQTGKLLSKDSLEINGAKLQSKMSSVNEDEIFELSGLTINDTKTKIGKDFYDSFYLEYSKLPKKISNAITITELPTMGRGSQISIETDDKTLYSFIANPNEEYLTEQANLSMKIILDYYRKKSLLKNEFRY